MDLTIPLNESRSKIIPLYGDFLIFDQENYHYCIVALVAVVYLTDVLVFAGVDGTFLLVVKHTCGLCSIVWYV